MISVDLKPLLQRLNARTTKAMEGAAGLCVARGHYEVTVEHLLLRVTEDADGDVVQILSHFDIDAAEFLRAVEGTVEELKSGNTGRPVFSPTLMEWIQEAWLVGSVELGLTEVRSGVLFSCLVSNPRRFGNGAYLDLLDKVGKDELRRNLLTIVSGSVEDVRAPGRAAAPEGAPGPRGDTALGRFTVDFTAEARAGRIDPIFGRDREIRQMVDILGRRRKNNPIIVGEAGVGKTALVEGLALRVIEGDVPEILQGVDLLGLDMGLLQAGASVKGEFENRLKGVIDEVKASPKPIVLFIDEAHTLIGAGGAAGGGDAANLLKPALARGELRTVAATTWSEYKKYFEKDPALARRFQPVKVDEPDAVGATGMLRGLRERYEQAHGVHIADSAVAACASLGSRYISGRQHPDKGVDLLDTAAARVKIAITSKPGSLEDLERRVETLTREQVALQRDAERGFEVDQERLGELEELLKDAQERHDTLRDRWLKEKEAVAHLLDLRKRVSLAEAGKTSPESKEGAEGETKSLDELRAELDAAGTALKEIQGAAPLIPTEVTGETVSQVVADWTGVPVGNMVKDEATAVLDFDRRLKERIKGQDQAVAAVAQGIKAAKAGVQDPSKPMGIFLFVGTSGVGKTECATGVADLLFGGEQFMTTIAMSEFQEKHTVSKLIGSPPGYVGYGEGGVLTEAVRQRPYSVVLLDEVEKADPEVLNLFYQVFDKGVLSDGEGRQIDFKNTCIFLTSNLATDEIMALCEGGERPSAEELASAIRPILSAHFKPALLGRMMIVPFYPLGPDVLADIVRLKMKKVVRRLHDSHRMAFHYSDAVVEQIAARCTEVESGARNIDHILQGTLLPQISTELLQRMSAGPLPSRLDLELDEAGEFALKFGDVE
jgi:type VI secretion system protein VasG